MLARQTLAARPYPKDPTRHDLGPSLSLPSSSGTPRSGAQKAGQGGGGGSRRKAKQKKGPSGDSSVMQRCLEVIEQLLEEEDAEPFAEPVCSDAYKPCCFCILRSHKLHCSSNHAAVQHLLEEHFNTPFTRQIAVPWTERKMLPEPGSGDTTTRLVASPLHCMYTYPSFGPALMLAMMTDYTCYMYVLLTGVCNSPRDDKE